MPLRPLREGAARGRERTGLLLTVDGVADLLGLAEPLRPERAFGLAVRGTVVREGLLVAVDRFWAARSW